MQRTPAVVIGCGYGGSAALGVIRALGRCRVPVTHLCPDRRSAAAWSRYARVVRAPRMAADPQGFLATLLQLGGDGGDKPPLIAVTEAEMLFAARHRERLSQRFLVPELPAERLLALDDRWLQGDTARRTGLLIPATMLLDSRESIEYVANNFTFPLVARPRMSSSTRSHNVYLTRGEWLRAAPELFDSPVHYIVQEQVPGPARNRHQALIFRGQRGQTLASMVTRNLRDNLVETVQMPDLTTLGERFLTAAGYTGMAAVEFKFHETTGRAVFLGMKIGFGFAQALAQRVGVNFPLAQYLELLRESPGTAASPPGGVKWVDASLDLRSAPAALLSGEYGILDWLRASAGIRCEAFFASDDWKPFLFYLTGLAYVTPSGRTEVRRKLRLAPR